MKLVLTLAFLVIIYYPQLLIAQEAKSKRLLPMPSGYNNRENSDYTKPVFFDPIKNNVSMPNLEFEYDLTEKNGGILNVGPVSISNNSFIVAIMPLSRWDAKLPELLGETKNTSVLMIKWPESFIKRGLFEVISRTGDILWSYRITESDKKDWQNRLNDWSKLIGTQERKRDIFWYSQFGIIDFDKKNKNLGKFDEPFRFCFTYEQDENRSMLCTQRHRFKTTGNKLSLVRIVDPVRPRVLIQNENAPLKQVLPIKESFEPMQFFAELSSGASYEFSVIPGQLNTLELVKTKFPGVLRLSGWGQNPYGNVFDLSFTNGLDDSSFFSKIGWQQTIGDLRRFWTTYIRESDSKAYVEGLGGGWFRQRFIFEDLPSEEIRPWLRDNTITSTYTNGTRIYGEKAQDTKIRSDELEVLRADSEEFAWRYQALQSGEMNRSYLIITDENDKDWQAFYEIYKGYPMELSLRLSGVITSNLETVFLGEAAYNIWAQNILGWNNHYLSRQRWGLSAKYFQSVASFTLGSGSSAREVTISVLNADLKYRLKPGIWGRDETWGLIGGYQKVDFNSIAGSMLGAGFFWGRSMPKVFDDLFNILPFMRYPKFTDLEFIYYMSSLDSNVKLDSNWALNFHGKVLWSQSFFGEAGFGIKSYSYVDSSLNKKAAFASAYGTVGIGLNF